MPDFKFDPNALTVRDLNDFYDITGLEFEEMIDTEGTVVVPKGKSPKVMLAMALIAGRRQDKSFTLEDAYDVKVVELVSVAEEAEAVPLAPESDSPASES